MRYYLDWKKNIWIDENCEVLHLSYDKEIRIVKDDFTKMGALEPLSQEFLFKLLQNANEQVPCEDLISISRIKPDDYDKRIPVRINDPSEVEEDLLDYCAEVSNAKDHLKVRKNAISRFFTDNGIKIYTQETDLKDIKKRPLLLTKKSKPNRFDGSLGIYLPTIETADDSLEADLLTPFEALSSKYLEKYEKLWASKISGRRMMGSGRLEINAKLADAFQLPGMYSPDNPTKKWTVFQSSNGLLTQKYWIEAPNGFGKSTFATSLLLASMCSEEALSQRDDIRMFHGITDTCLTLLLEGKDINAVLDDIGTEEPNWIYHVLDKSLNLQACHIERPEMLDSLIKEYNYKEALVIVVDGYDELEIKYRPFILNRLEGLLRREEYANHAIAIVTSRPLQQDWLPDISSYQKWVINPLDIYKDPAIVHKYVEAYSQNEKVAEEEKIAKTILGNFYLRQSINSPIALVLAIKYLLSGKSIHSTLREIIDEILYRYNYFKLSASKSDYRIVYEELALDILTRGKEYIADTNELGIIIKRLTKKLSEDYVIDVDAFPQKAYEKYAAMFYTNVALLEYKNDGSIDFVTPAFAWHLAAYALLRAYDIEGTAEEFAKELDSLSLESQYHVLVILATIAARFDLEPAERISFDCNIGTVENSIRNNIFSYIQRKWDDTSIDAEEKQYIHLAVEHILTNGYGDNVFSRNNQEINEENEKQRAYLEGIRLSE